MEGAGIGAAHRCRHLRHGSGIPPDRLKRKERLAPVVSPYHQGFHDYG